MYQIVRHDVVPVVATALVEGVVEAAVHHHRGHVVDKLGVQGAAGARDVPDDVKDGHEGLRSAGLARVGR